MFSSKHFYQTSRSTILIVITACLIAVFLFVSCTQPPTTPTVTAPAPSTIPATPTLIPTATPNSPIATHLPPKVFPLNFEHVVKVMTSPTPAVPLQKVSLVFLVDRSRSMLECDSELQDIPAEIIYFTTQLFGTLAPDYVRVGVIQFPKQKTASVQIDWLEPSKNEQELEEDIRAQSNNYDNDFRTAFDKSYAAMDGLPGDKILILISDGAFSYVVERDTNSADEISAERDNVRAWLQEHPGKLHMLNLDCPPMKVTYNAAELSNDRDMWSQKLGDNYGFVRNLSEAGQFVHAMIANTFLNDFFPDGGVWWFGDENEKTLELPGDTYKFGINLWSTGIESLSIEVPGKATETLKIDPVSRSLHQEVSTRGPKNGAACGPYEAKIKPESAPNSSFFAYFVAPKIMPAHELLNLKNVTIQIKADHDFEDSSQPVIWNYADFSLGFTGVFEAYDGMSIGENFKECYSTSIKVDFDPHRESEQPSSLSNPGKVNFSSIWKGEEYIYAAPLLDPATIDSPGNMMVSLAIHESCQ